MTLIEIVQDLQTLDGESTIYAAAPWSENSTAIVAPEPQAGGLPLEAANLGLRYFVEVFIARDFLEDWSKGLGKVPTLQEKCARLISYAINDA